MEQTPPPGKVPGAAHVRDPRHCHLPGRPRGPEPVRVRQVRLGVRGTALITGAARRIGRALALTAAEAGYDVAIHHRGADTYALALAAEIRALGRKAAAVKADFTHQNETA